MNEILARYFISSHDENEPSRETTLNVSLADEELIVIEFNEGGIYINFDQLDLLLKYISELRGLSHQNDGGKDKDK